MCIHHIFLGWFATETPCFDIKAKQLKLRLVLDSAKTSFSSSFGCFDTKLVSEDTLERTLICRVIFRETLGKEGPASLIVSYILTSIFAIVLLCTVENATTRPSRFCEHFPAYLSPLALSIAKRFSTKNFYAPCSGFSQQKRGWIFLVYVCMLKTTSVSSPNDPHPPTPSSYTTFN